MGGWSTTCERCKETIEFKEKECEQSGFTWHSKCFVCDVCYLPLNEISAKIRGRKNNKLLCSMHKFKLKGTQPMCKIYFALPSYRVVF